MLKFIYKVFLIALMSGSLLMIDISYKQIGLSQAFGQTPGTIPSSSTSTSSSTANVQAQNTQAANTQVEAAQSSEKLKTNGIKDSNMMATLTMTAVGVLTQRLWKCTLTTDMMVAAAGGAMFIGGEILAFMKLKKVMKDMETEITRDKYGNINQQQIETIQKLKQSYVEAKKTANTKKMLQMAAAAAFAAAGVIALTQYMAEMAAEKACLAALQTSAKTCMTTGKSMMSYPPTSALGAMYVSGGGMTELSGGLELGLDKFLTIPGPSFMIFTTAKAKDAAALAKETAASAQCPMSSAGTASCTAKRTMKTMNRGACPVPPAAVSIPFIKKSLYAGLTHKNEKRNIVYEIFSKYFLSEAQANLFSPMGIASSAAISYLLATSATLGITIDTYLAVPMNRAIIWGVLAGLTFMASSATDNVIAQIDANIAKIDAILNNLNSMAKGTALANTTIKNPGIQGVTPKPNPIKPFNYDEAEVNLDDIPGGKLPCYTGDGTKSCTSFEEQISKDAGYVAMNVPSKNLINGIMKAADGFNGRTKITTGAMANAAKVAGNANALNATLKKNRDELRKALKNSQIDLDKREKEFADSIEKSNRAQLKKMNMSANQMLGSMYGGTSFPEGDSKVASAAPADAATGDVGVAAGGVIDLNAGAAIGATDLGVTGADATAMSEEELAAQQAAALAAANANASGATMDDFELKNDITKDKDTSLFELISNRYQKSGYPRLFKRIK